MKEAKELLLEKEKLQERMNEIDKRLEELDNGAKAKEATLTY